MDIYYSVDNQNTRRQYTLPYTFDIHRPVEQEDIAALCAKDFYYRCDGFEYNWPVQFRLYESILSSEPLATFGVDLEHTPEFIAWREEE